MKTKIDISKEINYEGYATRVIAVDEKLDIKAGDEYKFFKKAESWQYPDQWAKSFMPELGTDDRYVYVFTCDKLKGHKVDYDNEEECEILDCVDMEDECELVVNEDTQNLRVVSIYSDEDAKEIGYYEVKLEVVG